VEVQNKEVIEGNLPQVGDRIKVHYTGRFSDGIIFDSSVTKKKPFEFKMGTGEVISCWDKALKDMRKG
jgi:FKBP-type peptidyl-prolyl cis-trans isomerase